MKTFPRYRAPGGYTIQPMPEPCGIVKAMGDTEPCYGRVFDLLRGETVIATAETYEQAREMAVSLLLEGYSRRLSEKRKP